MKSRSRKSFIRLTMAALVMLFFMGAEDTGCGPANWTVPALQANAGPDQNVTEGTPFTLDGSNSVEYDHPSVNTPPIPITDYIWTAYTYIEDYPEAYDSGYLFYIDSGPIVTVDHWLFSVGKYYIMLTVIDDEGSEDRDGLILNVTPITVPNNPPVANAGADQTVGLIGSPVLVTLDGNGSSDADGDPLTYEWNIISMPEGSTAVLSDDTAINPTFLADIAGSYVIRLIVNDGMANSLADDVTITVQPYLPPPPENTPPVADAGEDQSVDIGSTVTLDGSGSSDADGDLLTYEWNITSMPAGSTAVLSDSTVVEPTFISDMVGSYIVRLIVNDGNVSSLADDVTISVSDPSLIYLSKTGQTTSYDQLGNEVTDGSLKDDGFYQYGIHFSFTDNGDGTILDNNTLLTWEQGYSENNLTLAVAESYCTNKGVEWRLPNIYEFFSILNYWEDSALDGTYFNVAQDGYYWTSTNEAGSALNYWTINAANGQVPTATVANTSTNYVRCVKGEELMPPTSERYTKIGTDGTALPVYDNAWEAVRDNWTGLLWDKTTREYSNGWVEAINYCENLVLAGRSNWHLPNIKQVHYLMDMSNEISVLNSTYFEQKYNPLWTSTTDMFYGFERYVWTVSPINGIDSPYGPASKYESTYEAKCVSWDEP